MRYIRYICIDQIQIQYQKMSERQESSCTHNFTRDKLCQLCGIYKYRDQAMKSTLYATPADFRLVPYLASLRKQSPAPTDCKEMSSQCSLLLASICQKFQFTSQTLALGISLYQRLHKLHPHQRFWSSCCLIVAAKAIELDKNVPYLSRYQRYAEKTHTQQEYEEAERTIFIALQFQVHWTTFVTFLQFYLSCGFLFKADPLSPALLHFLEDDAIVKAKEIIKKGMFPQKNPQILALSILKSIRMKYALQSWPMQLQQLTGYKSQELNLLEKTPLESIQFNSKKVEYPIKEIYKIETMLGSRFENVLGNNNGGNKTENSVINKSQNMISYGSKNKIDLSLASKMHMDNMTGAKIDANSKSIIAKYSTMNKTTLKENCFSVSKPLLAPLKTKHNQLALMMGQYNSTSSVDLLNRRR